MTPGWAPPHERAPIGSQSLDADFAGLTVAARYAPSPISQGISGGAEERGQVVVMRRAAPAIDDLATFRSDRVQLIGSGHRLQGAVDRCQPDRLALRRGARDSRMTLRSLPRQIEPLPERSTTSSRNHGAAAVQLPYNAWWRCSWRPRPSGWSCARMRPRIV